MQLAQGRGFQQTLVLGSLASRRLVMQGLLRGSLQVGPNVRVHTREEGWGACVVFVTGRAEVGPGSVSLFSARLVFSVYLSDFLLFSFPLQAGRN